ncbi:MAG: endonuclease [Candidatus Thiodiazotropha sp. 6PLUC2]
MNLNHHAKYVDGLYYPDCHPGWGGCAEELFHYTSRYFAYAEAFLRNLTDQRQFNMSGYQATRLSTGQRRLMAAILANRPDCRSARDITQIVRGVINGEESVSQELTDHYQDQLKIIPENVELVYSGKTHHSELPKVEPLDPFLNLAARLKLPTAVRGHHVEIPLKELAQHLDSSNSSLRNTLQEAVLQLHFAGYQLKNHPGLTHKAAKQLENEQARLSRLNNRQPHLHSTYEIY